MTCKSILVVEDDEAVRFTILELLQFEKLGLPILAEPSVIAALKTIVKMPKPCLVLLDIMMPEMTGLEFIEELRRGTLLEECVVLIMTASASIKSTEFKVTYKPMELDSFLASIRSVCSPTSATQGST